MNRVCRKIAAFTAATLLLAAAFTGCKAAAPTPKVKITLMHGWGGSAQDHVAMRQIYADFEKENPDIKLQYDASPDLSVVLDKANDMLALDKMPDIVSTNGDTEFVQAATIKGFALDFMPYLTKDEAFRASVSDRALRAWQTPEKAVYTLSDAQEIVGYWYNEELLRAAGVTETGANTGAVKLPRTWDEFWQAWDKIEQYAAATGQEVAPASVDSAQAKRLLGALLAGNDGGAAYMQGSVKVCPEESLTYALEKLAEVYGRPGEVIPSENDARQRFFDGYTAFYFNGVWANIQLEENDLENVIACTAYPGTDGETVAYVSPSSGYVVSNVGTPAEIEARVRFVKYMLSEPVQRRIVRETRQAPSNPVIGTDWITQQAPVLGKALQACYEANVQILTFSTVLKSDESAAALERYLEKPSEENKQAFYTIVTQTQASGKDA